MAVRTKKRKSTRSITCLIVPNKTRQDSQIIRVETWLKRSAPQGEGSFAFQVQSRQDAKGEWHIDGLILVQDPIETKMQQEIDLLCNLIRQNPNSGQEAIASLAMEEGIPRDAAIRELKEGIGKYWQVRRSSHNKLSYSLVQK